MLGYFSIFLCWVRFWGLGQVLGKNLRPVPDPMVVASRKSWLKITFALVSQVFWWVKSYWLGCMAHYQVFP